MSDRERRIRDEAYRLWEAAGRPPTDDDSYWYEAERRIAAGEAEPVPPLSKSKGKAVPVVVKSAGNSGVEGRAVMAPEPKAAKKDKAGKAVAPKKGEAVDIVAAPKKAAAALDKKPGKDAKGEVKDAKGEGKPRKPKA